MRLDLIHLMQYIPQLLNSVTIDDYIIFDKWSLVIQCMSGTVEACYRGLGL